MQVVTQLSTEFSLKHLYLMKKKKEKEKKAYEV